MIDPSATQGTRRLSRGGVLLSLLLAGCGGEREPAIREDLAPAPPDLSARRVHTPDPELRPAPEDGQGTVRIVPGDPVVAATWGRWMVEWVAGPDGIATGGGAVLQVSPFWGWSPPQTRAPGRPGYSTLAWSSPDAVLTLGEGAVPMTLVARVEEGRLGAGDTLRFVYGDSTRGGPGSLARADIYREDFEELLIKTDGNGDGFFVAIPDQPTLEILPGPAVGLAVAAPAVVEPGVRFDVAIHALDSQQNLADPPRGTLRLLLRDLGRDGSASPPDTLAVARAASPGDLRRRVRIERPGLYRLRAEIETAHVLAGENDLLLVEAASPFGGILWGDIHAHSALSDGTGAPADLLHYARHVSGLDVAAVTDHDAHGLFPLAERGGWQTVRDATRDAYEPGRFVTLLAYEWTSWTWGHRNVYYPAAEGEVFAFLSDDADTPDDLWDRIERFGGVTIPHHPGGGPVPVDWSVPSREERETVVEICSIHGSSEAPGVERGIYRPVPGATVRDALNAGHRLGILAAGDTHDGHPGRRTNGAPANGLAAFRTSTRTREAVWEALRDRRVYGTSGPRILLATDWGGIAPGRELGRAPSGPLTVRVAAPEPIEAVQVVTSAGIVESEYGGGRRVTRSFFESAPPPEIEWLYVRVTLASGEAAWESPYWFAGGKP